MSFRDTVDMASREPKPGEEFSPFAVLWALLRALWR
jgi:hypothetical protein